MKDYTIKSIVRSLVLDYLAGEGIDNDEFATSITDFVDEYNCVGEDKEQYDFIEEMWKEQVNNNLTRECIWMEARVNNKIKPEDKTASEYSSAIVEFLKQDIDWPRMYWTVETIFSDDSLEVMCPACETGTYMENQEKGECNACGVNLEIPQPDPEDETINVNRIDMDMIMRVASQHLDDLPAEYKKAYENLERQVR